MWRIDSYNPNVVVSASSLSASQSDNFYGSAFPNIGSTERTYADGIGGGTIQVSQGNGLSYTVIAAENENGTTTTQRSIYGATGTVTSSTGSAPRHPTTTGPDSTNNVIAGILQTTATSAAGLLSHTYARPAVYDRFSTTSYTYGSGPTPKTATATTLVASTSMGVVNYFVPTNTNTDTANTAASTSLAPASDQSTVTVATTRSVAGNAYGGAELDYFLLASDEWAWSVTHTDTINGVFALEDIADEITDRTWRPGKHTTTASRADAPGTYSYSAVSFYLEGAVSSYSASTTAERATVSTGMNPSLHGGYDQLPTPATETWHATQTFVTTTSISFILQSATVAGNASTSLQPPTGTATGDGVVVTQFASSRSGAGTDAGSVPYTRTVTGASSIGITTTALVVMTTCHDFLRDGSGNILDDTTRATTTAQSATASFVDSSLAPYLSIHQTQVVGPSSSQTTLVTDGDGHAASTFTTGVPLVMFEALEVAYTILEPAFSRALRFGSSGKCRQIIGPDSSWHYPFFSEVREGLWMPMTYAGGRTAAARDTSSASYDGNTAPVSVDGTGPARYFSYSWGRTGDERGVSISSSWSDTAASTGASASTRCIIRPSDDDAASFYAIRDAAQNSFLADRGVIAVGGTQWGGHGASVRLGVGIWELTTNDATGGNTSTRMTLSEESMMTVDPASVLALRAIPAYRLLTVTADRSDGDDVSVFPRGEFVP